MSFEEEGEDLRDRGSGSADLAPELLNRGVARIHQLAKSRSEQLLPGAQDKPGPAQATRFHDIGRRIQALMGTGAVIKVSLKPLGLNGAVRQTAIRKNRSGASDRRVTVAGDGNDLRARRMFTPGVGTMDMHRPAIGADGAGTVQTGFGNLNPPSNFKKSRS